MKMQSPYHARYRLIGTVPERWWLGETLTLTIEVTNQGSAPWLTFGPNPVRLSYHWHDRHGRPIIQDGIRTPLPTSVPPGACATVDMRIDSPPAAGDYRLIIELLEEGFRWFSDYQVAPLKLMLSYAPGPAPRISLINGNCTIHDAVGNHLIAEMRSLRRAGYNTLLITEFLDSRLPGDIRRAAVAITLADIQQPERRLQHVANHFFSSDIVILTYSTYYELAQVIKLARDSIVIFDYHGVTPTAFWDPMQPGYDDLVQGHQHITLVRYADYAITRSNYMRDELVQTGLIPAERVRVTPLGTLHQSGRGTPDPAIIERYHLASRRVLLYVGRMARNKRIEDLVEALPLVLHHHPHAVLLLVGENTAPPYAAYTAEVRQRAEELGCADHVIFTGQVPTIEPYYAICDLFVTASMHEGFGMPIIEAMAHGKPVVAAASTALVETAGAGGGVLFEPGNPADLAAKINDLLHELAPAKPPPLPTPPVPPPAATRTDTVDTMQDALRGRRIVFVTPRYGPAIIGGAERLILGWAEQLAQRGYAIEVLTTSVVNMDTWGSHTESSVEYTEESLNGVAVRRFAPDNVDAAIFHQIYTRASQHHPIHYSEERAFMRHNFQSNALNTYLREHANDIVCAIFAPYLFGTTYWGMQVVPEKAIIVPCLHDEASARFTVFREMLEGAAGIFFNTRAECDFATTTLNITNPSRAVVGYGFDPDTPPGNAAAFRARYHLPEEIILYSGRLEAGKNVNLLIDFFVRYKEEHPGALTLVLTGRNAGHVAIPHRHDIVPLGVLPEAELPDAFAAATLLCQPSLNESFSIVMMEAWLQGRPVLVHADCAVTSSHIHASGGGATFHNYASFRDAVQQFVTDPQHAARLGQAGGAYVRQHYNWETITHQILQGIIAFTRPRTRYEQLARRGVQHALTFDHPRFESATLDVVEQALVPAYGDIPWQARQQLQRLADVATSDYTIRSHLPVVGHLVAWTRRQLTSHLKEPYIDPIITRQRNFNQEVLHTLLPLLAKNSYHQNRLKREVAILRDAIEHDATRPNDDGANQHPPDHEQPPDHDAPHTL